MASGSRRNDGAVAAVEPRSPFRSGPIRAHKRKSRALPGLPILCFFRAFLCVLCDQRGAFPLLPLIRRRAQLTVEDVVADARHRLELARPARADGARVVM